MSSIHPALLLRRALLLDAAGSAAVGLLQLAATAPLAAQTTLPGALLLESGLFMLPYAALLLWMQRRAALPRALVLLVIVGNAGWALGALGAGVLLQPAALGWAWLAVHALWVLAMAALQRAGLARSGMAAAGRPLGAAGSA